MLNLRRLDRVDYAEPGEAAASFQRTVISSRPFDATVAGLRAAIERAGLWVLLEIDPQALLRHGGYSIGSARQVYFFHPRYVARILSTDPAALLEAPLTFVVTGAHDDHATVRWADPVFAFGRYRHAALATLGQELAALCETIAATAGQS